MTNVYMWGDPLPFTLYKIVQFGVLMECKSRGFIVYRKNCKQTPYMKNNCKLLPHIFATWETGKKDRKCRMETVAYLLRSRTTDNDCTLS